MNDTISECLSLKPATVAGVGNAVTAAGANAINLGQWREIWADAMARSIPLTERAVYAGYRADCVAWAFLAGYQAALRVVDPSIANDQLASFCVTESAGNRPANIQTRLSRQADGSYCVSGKKSWLALGKACDLLLVAAASDDPDALQDSDIAAGKGRARIRMVRVSTALPGVSILPKQDVAIIPEVPHASAVLEQVRIQARDILPGDGYADFVKPFRTLEDIHISAAVLAYLLREARALQWPQQFSEKIVAALAGLCALGNRAANAPQTHIALAGMLLNVRAIQTEAGQLWATHGDDPRAQRWARDASMFGMAGKIHALRTQRAWQALSRE